MKLNTLWIAPVALALGLGAFSTTAEAGPRRGQDRGVDRGRRTPPPPPERNARRPRRGPRARVGIPAGPMDINRDGVVTRVELRRFHRVEARATARRLDRNLDGWISPREFRRATRRGRFARRDLDRDGRVTRIERRLAKRARRTGIPTRRLVRAEMREADRTFSRLDRDRDGLLTRWEIRPALAWR